MKKKGASAPFFVPDDRLKLFLDFLFLLTRWF